ncbi:NmrA/HSCARG family protein, partial [Priestia megaterium]
KIAEIISEVTGKEIKISTLSVEEALEQGVHPLSVRGQEWDNVAGYNVDIDLLKTYNIKLTSFKEFVEKHKDQFRID